MDVTSYLDRIGFVGTAGIDLATLCRMQRSHLRHIPYENFDVQMGKRVTLSPKDAFTKLVTGRRGGWCYEMNGLFGWALESLGFRVMPMTGAVMRAQRGPTAIGNHLVLSVELDQPYLADVGLGDGPLEPIPIKEGVYQQEWRTLRLERLNDGWWRYHNHDNAFAPTFDFQHRPADWDLLADKCEWLQTSPDSRFVQNAVCMRHSPEGIAALVGRVLKTMSRDGTTDQLLNVANEYVQVLWDTFGIELPQAVDLWPKIVQRHEALFGMEG